MEESQVAYSEEEGLNFYQIVMAQLRRCANLLSSDLTLSTQEVVKVNASTGVKELVPIQDKKVELIRSVEVFDSLLFPHYDKTMEGIKEQLDEKMKEIGERFKNDFLDWFARAELPPKERADIGLMLNYGIFPDDQPLSFLEQEWKIKIMRRLFKELCSLLQRKDYLAGEVYEE